MTLISFFDEDPIDNIGDIVLLKPSRCIFLGDDKLMKKRRRNLITKFVENRSMETTVEFHSLPRGDIDGTLGLLRELIERYPDCIFDVTGGTEMHLAAAGIISGMYDIPLYQRNGKNGKLLWQYGCQLAPQAAALSVSEVISLHNGAVIDETMMSKPDITDALGQDIIHLWEIAKKDPAGWNNTCTSLAELTEKSETFDPLQIVVTGQQDQKAFYRADMPILADLMVGGYLQEVDYAWSGISFRYRDGDIRMILTKAGMLLELYTYMAAHWADDRAVSICLDWDGMDANKGGIQTRNELDVMLTSGLLPICISCKNGEFDKNALYELDTISKHFAGRYAKKVLISSYGGKSEQSLKTLERRARDMNIVPIFDVHRLSYEEFSQRLRHELIGEG